jgi:flagellar hook-length control protein FliK
MTSSAALLPLGDGSVGTGRSGAVSNGRGARSDPFGGGVDGSSFDQRLAEAERAVEGALRRAEARAAAGGAGGSSSPGEATQPESSTPAGSAERAAPSTRDGERSEADEGDTGARAQGPDDGPSPNPTRAEAAGRRHSGADEGTADRGPASEEDEEVPEDALAAPVAPLVPPEPIRGGAPPLVEVARVAVALGAFGANAARGANPAGASAPATPAPALEVDTGAATPAPFAVEEEALASEVAVVDASGAAADAPAFEDALATVEAPTERRADAATPANATAERPTIERPSEAAATRPLDPTQLAASNERAARVLEQVRMFVHPGLRRATLELSPANLGRIDVQITFERGEVAAHLVVEAVDTYEALQRHMPELRASLERGGLDVGQLELSFGARDGSQAREQRGEPSRGRAGGAANERAAANDPRGVETVWLQPRTVAHDRVDTLA